jgi:hypothetical protein
MPRRLRRLGILMCPGSSRGFSEFLSVPGILSVLRLFGLLGVLGILRILSVL